MMHHTKFIWRMPNQVKSRRERRKADLFKVLPHNGSIVVLVLKPNDWNFELILQFEAIVNPESIELTGHRYKDGCNGYLALQESKRFEVWILALRIPDFYIQGHRFLYWDPPHPNRHDLVVFGAQEAPRKASGSCVPYGLIALLITDADIWGHVKQRNNKDINEDLPVSSVPTSLRRE